MRRFRGSGERLPRGVIGQIVEQILRCADTFDVAHEVVVKIDYILEQFRVHGTFFGSL